MDSKKKLVISIIVLAAVIAIAAGAYAVLKNNVAKPDATDSATATNSSMDSTTAGKSATTNSGSVAATASSTSASASVSGSASASTSGSANTSASSSKSASASSGNATQAQNPWYAALAPDTLVVGELSPDFTVYDADGNEVKLSQFLGKQPIVINFWTSWCPYCKTEMPDFQNLYDEYGDKVTFLFIDCMDGQRETVATAQQYMKDKGFTVPVYYDHDFAAETIFNVYYYPTTTVIGADGVVVSSKSAVLDAYEMGKTLDGLLAK